MANIIITHELCAEDRARLDRLTAAIEALQPTTITLAPVTPKDDPEQQTIDLDAVQQKLAETMAKASTHASTPKNTVEEAEPSTQATTPSEEEKPTEEEITQAEETVEPAKPTVTLEQIQQKVVQLAAGGNGAKKAKVREIVNAYAKKVSDLPEDKWTEVWDKLTALESEG
jgi:hypothetical protein